MRDGEAKLHEAVEQCYAAFANVPRPVQLDAAPGRNADEILRTLTSAPVRALANDQIGPYAGWAITTVGNERDYRYFLPRIIELATTDTSWAGSMPPVIADKVKMAGWESWSSAEVGAVLVAFHAGMDACIARHPSDDADVGLWFCGLVSLGQKPSAMLAQFVTARWPNAPLQLAQFVMHDAKLVLSPKRSFWDDVDQCARHQVLAALREEPARHLLVAAAARTSAEDNASFLVPALDILRTLPSINA